ncbi:MAG: S8 family serine peptidase [Chloroflexi bacterium]|nr:S8 family serine peptidase [Chloroflexota bacterium]
MTNEEIRRMTKGGILLVLACFFAVGLNTGPAQADEGSSPMGPSFVGFAPNKIVVRFSDAVTKSLDDSALATGTTGHPALDQLGKRHDVVGIHQQFPGVGPQVLQGRELDLSGWHKIQFADSVDVEAVAKEYKSLLQVEDSQPIGIHAIDVMPNDSFFKDNGALPDQWFLDQANDVDMDGPEAWDIETGDESIIVAVLDTGVRYFHKDLGGANASFADPTNVDGNVWVNLAEMNGIAGFDDDGNGYEDDELGWDFVDGIVPCSPGEDCSTEDNDPRDFDGHGTHVAGIIGALNNNGYATASAAGGWGNGTLEAAGNGVKIMSLRIGWSAPNGAFVGMDFAAQALVYAVENGATLANGSWGSSNTGGIAAAMDFFTASGGLFFNAAGNGNSDTPPYLGTRSDVISVASTDEVDGKSSLSDFGSWVDIAAPGTSILSLYHVSSDPGTDYVAVLDGTSMASPNALAVAALIWSRNPGLAAADVKQALFDSSENIDALNPGFVGLLGAGRVNAFNAVSTVVPPQGTLDVTPLGDLESSGPQGGPFSPPSQEYTVTNTGSTGIDWTLSKTQNWVSPLSVAGFLSAGASDTVTVSINSNANSLTPGNYNDIVTFTNVTNGLGNTSRNVTLTVLPSQGTMDVTPLEGLESSGPQGGPFSPQSQQYTVTNTGGTGIDWTFSKTQNWVSPFSVAGFLSAGASDTVTVSINSNANSLTPGNYNDTVTFTNVTNGLGNTSRNVTLTVANVNDAPQITSSAMTTATQNLLYSYDVDATDPDAGDTLTFSLDVAPAGMTIDAVTGLVEWTPDNSQVGPNDVTVRVTDAGLLFDTQAFVVTVANVNDAPQITSAAVTTATQDLLYSYDVDATDPDVGDTLTFSLDVSPPGMTIDAVTGLVQWTPDNSQVGLNDVTVRATDAGSLFDTQAFVVTVAIAVEPDISVLPATVDFGQVTVGGSGDQTVTVSNVGGADLDVSNLQTTNAAFFIVAPTPPFTIVPGGSQDVTVRFSPTVAGVQNGNLNITSNDPDTGLLIVPLTGEGTAPAVELRINAGGDVFSDFTDFNGDLFVADKPFVVGDSGFVGGAGHGPIGAISGTTDDGLYGTLRADASSFSYVFDNLPSGDYDVTLYFTTIFEGQLFDVIVEGVVVLDDIDVAALAGGTYMAYTEAFTSTVADGQMNIDFVSVTGIPLVSAISVITAVP